MGLDLGSVVNSVANISSRAGKNKQGGQTPIKERTYEIGRYKDSSLQQFLNVMSTNGVQIKSNFEVEWSVLDGFQFYCQTITIPGIKNNASELYYKGRQVNIPTFMEQEHTFQMTVINDANGQLYPFIRQILAIQADNGKPDNNSLMRIKSRGDYWNNGGMQTVLKGVKLMSISSLDYGHTDNSIQTFTIEGYANFTHFEFGEEKKRGENETFQPFDYKTIQVVKKDGFFDKIDKISGKFSTVLGR